MPQYYEKLEVKRESVKVTNNACILLNQNGEEVCRLSKDIARTFGLIEDPPTKTF